MAAHEVIFKGSAADFVRFVDDFERRRRLGSTVFHAFPFWRGHPDEVAVWPPESEHTAQIAAYALPGERTLLECETLSPAAWPDIEPHWQELLAELARLGCIESEAAPAKRKKSQAEEKAARQEKVLADYVAGHTIEKIAERQAMGKRTVNRDLAELEEAGKIIRDKSASATKSGTKHGTAMAQDG